MHSDSTALCIARFRRHGHMLTLLAVIVQCCDRLLHNMTCSQQWEVHTLTNWLDLTPACQSSGKTHTMGSSGTGDQQVSGVIPEVMRAIFMKIPGYQHRSKFVIKVSFVEVYQVRGSAHVSTRVKWVAETSYQRCPGGGVCGEDVRHPISPAQSAP
jgi:hypothetical protein